MPPQPQAVSGDGDGDGHGEEDPKVGRGDGGPWFGVKSEGVVHAEERLQCVLVGRFDGGSQWLAYGYECTGEEGQGQHCYRLHSCAVLPGFLCHLRSGFGEFYVQQVVASTFFGDPARTLGDLNVEPVVSLDVEIRDLYHCQCLHPKSSMDSNANIQPLTGS